MKEILEIVNQLQSTSSRTEKENILKQNEDNQLWKDILYFVYNPYIVTGLSKKKINKRIKETYRTLIPDSIEVMMSYLFHNNTGKDSDIFVAQNFINKQPIELQELATKILTKDLSLGIEAKTINKIYKGLIPTFNVMLAHKYSDHEHKVTGTFILSEKLDGIRCVLIKGENGIKFFSRQGQPIEELVEIESEAKKLPNGVYDGELILRNDSGLSSDDLYRATVKVVRKDGDKKNVEFHVFDLMNLEDFYRGKCNQDCLKRKLTLSSLIGKKFTWIKEVESLYIGNDKSVIFELLDEVTSKGKEGIMLNVADAPYECKRSAAILKVKKMNTVDLEVIGFDEGEGKYIGMLGRLNVIYKGYIVGVGSGFTDEDRVYIWNNKHELAGKIVEVQYFEESKNQNGGISLRFPVFKGFRFDKNEESYN